MVHQIYLHVTQNMELHRIIWYSSFPTPNFNLSPTLVLNPSLLQVLNPAPSLLDPPAIFQGIDVLPYGVHISIVYELL